MPVLGEKSRTGIGRLPFGDVGKSAYVLGIFGKTAPRHGHAVTGRCCSDSVFRIAVDARIGIRGSVSRLFSFAYAFGKQVFDLPVEGAEIFLCPGRKIPVQEIRKPERDLLFILPVHPPYSVPELTTGCASLFPQRTTRRLETMAALRSSSSST